MAYISEFTGNEIDGRLSKLPTDIVYLSGDADTDGSIRMTTSPTSGQALIESRVSGVWTSSYVDNVAIQLNSAGDKVTANVTLEVPGGSIEIGETTSLSSCSESLILTQELTGESFYAATSLFDDTGSSLPVYPNLGAEFTLNIQTVFTETLTDNPLTYSITGTVTSPNKRQVRDITFKTGAAMTNVRGKFTDNATGIIMRYIPDKYIYDTGTGGLDLISGDNKLDFISTAASSPGTYNLGVNPFWINNGQQVDIEIVADSVNLLGDVSGIPYQVAQVQDGPLTFLSKKETADRHQTTGILEGGVISIATGTTVDWTAGRGIVTNYSDPENVIVSDVTWDAVSGYTPTNLATDGTTLFGYDSAGSLQEILSTAVSIEDSHDYIFFASATHFSSTIVNVITAPGNMGYNGIGSYSDFMNLVIGPANIDGNIYGPNGTNLNIDVVGGNAYMIGSNFRTNPKLSDVVTLSSGTAISFQKVYRSADPGLNMLYDGAATTAIDPTQYDDGSGTLATVGAGNWTIQRIFRSRTGSTFVAYGQQEFTTKALALEALGSEPFTEKDPLPFTLFRCSLVVSEGALDLSDTGEAEFFAQSSFRTGGAQSTSATIPGVTSPGGVDRSIQYNDANTFGGTSDFTLTNTGGDNTLNLFSSAADKDVTFNLKTSAGNDVISLTHDDNSGLSSFNVNNDSGAARFSLVHLGALNNTTISTFSGGRLSVVSDENLNLTASETMSINSIGNFPVVVGNNGATLTIGNTATNYAFTFLNVSANSVPLIVLQKTGANGGTSQIFTSTVTPEGAITGNGGDLCILDSGTSSELSLKRSDGVNTGWVNLLHTESGVQGPASSTDNAVATWDGTTGLLLQNSKVLVSSSVSSTFLDIDTVTATGLSRLAFRNNAAENRVTLTYNQLADSYTVATTTGVDTLITSGGTAELRSADELRMQATGDFPITINNDGATLTINDVASNYKFTFDHILDHTVPLIEFNTSGVSGGNSNWFFGTVSPEGVITGDGGDVLVRSDGTNSDIYLKRVNGGNTGWVDLLHSESGVKGPTTSTVNALAVFDVTDGSSIDNVPTATLFSDATTTSLELKPVTSAGNAEINFRTAAGGTKGQLYYYESADQLNLETDAAKLNIANYGGPIGFEQTAGNFDLVIQTSSPVGSTIGNIGDITLYISDPSIYLNRLNNSSVWDRISLDGDTNAYGGLGKLQNRLKWSEDLTNAVWTDPVGNSTVTSDNTSFGPIPGELADTVEWTSAGLGLRQSGIGTVNGNTYTVSFWARHLLGAVQVLSVDIGDGQTASFTIDSTEWQRYTATIIAGGTGAFLDFNCGGTSTFGIRGVQVNDGSEAYPYMKREDTAKQGTTDYGLTVNDDIETTGIISGSMAMLKANFAATTTTAALGTASIYACTDTTAARTLTISTSTIALGSTTNALQITVKDESGGAGTNNITITPESGTIDGQSSVVISADYGDIMMYSNGTNLFTIGI
jgi:hypothetical protein